MLPTISNILSKNGIVVHDVDIWVDSLGYIKSDLIPNEGINKMNEILDEIGLKLNKNMFAAGGFVSGCLFNREYSDIDIYINKDTDKSVFDGMEVTDSIGDITDLMHNGYKIQLINLSDDGRTHSAENFTISSHIVSTIMGYDQTASMFAYDGSRVISTKLAVHLASGNISALNTTDKGGRFINDNNIRRFNKYKSRGWTICHLQNSGMRNIDEMCKEELTSLKVGQHFTYWAVDT